MNKIIGISLSVTIAAVYWAGYVVGYTSTKLKG